MKTKLTPLALLIPTVVLAQPAPQAPQPFQVAPPVVNQQINPTNTSHSSTGTAAQTLIKQNSGFVSPPVNPIAAAAYEKASKSTKTMSSSKSACEKTTYGSICVTAGGNLD
jgi:hypothetical protein